MAGPGKPQKKRGRKGPPPEPLEDVAHEELMRPKAAVGTASKAKLKNARAAPATTGEGAPRSVREARKWLAAAALVLERLPHASHRLEFVAKALRIYLRGYDDSLEHALCLVAQPHRPSAPGARKALAREAHVLRERGLQWPRVIDELEKKHHRTFDPGTIRKYHREFLKELNLEKTATEIAAEIVRKLERDDRRAHRRARIVMGRMGSK
jgi:hypothetical protein